MNFRDLLVPVFFGLFCTMGIQYVFFGNKTQAPAEVHFIAAPKKGQYDPLRSTIDFMTEKQQSSVKTDIETNWGCISFSSHGGAIDSIDFKREVQGNIETIRTTFPQIDLSKKEFIVALDEDTPTYYTYKGHNETDNTHEILYSAHNEKCVLEKKFIVDKNATKIDLVLTITPRDMAYITPRIIYPAPVMADLVGTDIISSVIIDRNDGFSKKGINQINTNMGWFEPSMFGMDNRYFIYALITDTDGFAQRAYYTFSEDKQLSSVLEGPEVSTATEWRMSFYCGPKDLTAISLVDTRLELTLDYSGMLSMLAKLMLRILQWLYTYLHNYGLAIIILTLLIQLLLLPLSMRNGEEQFKQQQVEYQKRLALIKHKFKNNPEKLAVEQAELFRTHGLPSLGCLIPLLLQLPLFFALSRVLSSSFELYKAPLFWMTDLSAKDPYYILPLLFIGMMIINDGSVVDPQQRMIKTISAIVFGAFISTFSAGLALYIVVGRVFGVMQPRILKYFNLV